MITTLDRALPTQPLAARIVLLVGSALLLAGAFTVAAHADDRRGPPRGGNHRHDFHGHPGYGGGYYGPPPVAYGGPYYPPPPVVYGPGVGVNLPGLNINIR